MKYPGQRIQLDIKYVPKDCVTGRNSYYQFTAIDEYSRQRYLQAYEEKSTYTAVTFVEEVEKYFKYKIECIQTDNGLEFTNRLTTWREKKTFFEEALRAKGIQHKLIKPYTPRHNGKVERSHRKDQEWFYNRRKFFNLEDLKSQLRRYMRWYNNFPMRPLQYRSPNEVLKLYSFQ
jgi:transposase InsO family protein